MNPNDNFFVISTIIKIIIKIFIIKFNISKYFIKFFYVKSIKVSLLIKLKFETL